MLQFLPPLLRLVPSPLRDLALTIGGAPGAMRSYQGRSDAAALLDLRDGRLPDPPPELREGSTPSNRSERFSTHNNPLPELPPAPASRTTVSGARAMGVKRFEGHEPNDDWWDRVAAAAAGAEDSDGPGTPGRKGLIGRARAVSEQVVQRSTSGSKPSTPTKSKGKAVAISTAAGVKAAASAITVTAVHDQLHNFAKHSLDDIASSFS